MSSEGLANDIILADAKEAFAKEAFAKEAFAKEAFAKEVLAKERFAKDSLLSCATRMGAGWGGWSGLGQGLTWSPTHGPRDPTGRPYLGVRSQGLPDCWPPPDPAVALAGGRCRRACVYVPLCV